MATQNVLLFGDQTTETLASIQNLARQSKKSPSLHRFLREATDFIQTHSAVLEPSERQRFYSFETLLDLAEEYAKQEIPDDLLATILSYVSRLGELLMYVASIPAHQLILTFRSAILTMIQSFLVLPKLQYISLGCVLGFYLLQPLQVPKISMI